MNREISLCDKFIICRSAFYKVFRGLLTKIFLKKSNGLLFIGKYVTISHGKNIVCGKNVKFEDYSEIHGLCKEGLVFGNGVTIGRGVMIRPSSYYGVGEIGKGLTIGDNSSIGPNTYVGCAGKITIGNNVMFGPRCSLFAENHVFSDKRNSIKNQGVVQKGITIEDDCWVGSNCIILDGVTIGKGSVIGAGTLISKDVPAGSIIIDRRNREDKMRT
ncbi:TPA: acyltransferase [Streptococcus suis]|uniref:Acetyltransferase n=1 Tax=Streptococcus suis TaxID=1307 RepID=A0A1P8VS93_STRSU|nr:acyltransferase [Streptococcus suis]APZ79375.1 Acetyltransferase [Streptococcus suis]APZ79393.1 Galactoside O-acetyltransferase [Streptococcus suis]APZ79481.1 Acetyltransferase [Streptococcus suis]MBM7321317.1 acyltransferase [Streptococcus suis]MCK3924130.1 acyltransferase [Streptococcus suis]